MIKCACGKIVWDGLNLKSRIAQLDFKVGFMNIKCSSCKRWINGISTKYLTGEVKEDYILKERIDRKESKDYDTERAHY